MSKKWYFFGGKHKGKEIVYVINKSNVATADDIADSFHRKKFKEPRNYGYTYLKPKPFGFDAPLKFVKVPKTFKPKPHREDFIDRLIAYESDEGMTEKQNEKFLKEVEKKGLGNKLQGHYGRAIENMHSRRKMRSVS